MVVLGQKGIGKTQLVLRFVESILESQSDVSVFWVSATSTETIERAYREIARHLFGTRIFDDQEDLKERVRQRLSTADAGKWLLVIDEVNDLSTYNGVRAEEMLLQSISKSETGKIIFTTREAHMAEALAGGNAINLGMLAEPEAMDILWQTLKRKELLDDGVNARELIRTLESTPRAIYTAAVHINWRGCTLAEYLSSLTEATTAKTSALDDSAQQQPQYRSHVPLPSSSLSNTSLHIPSNSSASSIESRPHNDIRVGRYRYMPISNVSSAAPRSRTLTWSRPVRACFILISLGFVIIAGSLAVGLYYTIAEDRVGDGFTTSSYILAVGTLVLAAPMAKHYPQCRCWDSGNYGGSLLPLGDA